MEPEVVEEVPLEEPRGRVGDLARRGSRDARRGRRGSRSGCGCCPLEPHRPGALAVDLDDEDAERLGLGLRALDLGDELLASLRAHRGEERLDVLVRDELDEELDVVARARRIVTLTRATPARGTPK